LLPVSKTTYIKSPFECKHGQTRNNRSLIQQIDDDSRAWKLNFLCTHKASVIQRGIDIESREEK
ncbi:hypothetical protein NPIL_478351, partial [Nephila pilipes]